MSEYKPQGDWIFVEKVDYEKEQTTEAGVIFKTKSVLDTMYVEATIVAMGPGLPIPNGDVPEVDYSVGSKILYDVRSRTGTYKDYDIIRREHIISAIEE